MSKKEKEKKFILYNNQKKKLEEYKIDSSIPLLLYENKVRVPKDNEIKDNTLIKKRLSEIQDFIPLYEPLSKKIFMISKENVYDRVTYGHYRIPLQSLLTELSKSKDLSIFEKIQDLMSNYDLETLEVTYLKVIYYHTTKVGKNITTCQRPSFNSELSINSYPNVTPYYNRDELINLALNMRLIKPDKTYYDIEKVEKLCSVVQEKDLPAKTIINHKEYIIKNDATSLIQHYTFNGCYPFNKYLRSDRLDTHKNIILENNIKLIWNLCLNSPLFEKKYTVYRFLKDDTFSAGQKNLLLSDLKIGDIFYDSGFLSTTRDPFYRSDYYQFGFVLLKINLPRDRKGCGLCVESLSHFSQEQEIILPPYSELKLVSRDDKFNFFHIDNNFQSQVIKKYEFDFVGPLRTTFEDKYLPSEPTQKPLELLEISLYSASLASKLKEFQANFSNKSNQFDTIIGEKVFTSVIEWYDSTSAYKNFYAANNINGFSIYSFFKNSIIFFIEIMESTKEILVNYYFKKSQSEILFQNIREEDFLLFISKLAYLFKIQKISLYCHYKLCGSSNSNYCVDYYKYLKNSDKRFKIKEIIPKFDYLQLDKLKNIQVSTILTIKDRDELYQIFTNLNKNMSCADFYIYIVENHCQLIKVFEEKIKRIFTGLSQFYNPFLYDYYHFDPFLYLYNKNMISSLPEIEDSAVESIGKKDLLPLENILECNNRGLRVRV